uniref:GH10 domain-containing protein n=1 Tax=Steinernema glaseri TaxID=37863 RepID=A0A1I7ZGZ6_9BILA
MEAVSTFVPNEITFMAYNETFQASPQDWIDVNADVRGLQAPGSSGRIPASPNPPRGHVASPPTGPRNGNRVPALRKSPST